MAEQEINTLRQQLEKSLQQNQRLLSEYTSSEIERRSLQTGLDSHASQDKETRQLKAALADCRFQLKKLNEDIATERTLAEMERIKFMKNYEHKISELKAQLEHDNHTWIKRFDIRDAEYKQEVEEARKKYFDQSQEEIRKFKVTTDTKFQTILKEHEEAIIKIKNEISKTHKTFKEEKQHMIKDSEEKLGQELKAAHERTAIELSRKEKEYELRVSLIENERKHESHQHEYTKKQFVSVKDNLYEQVYKLTTEKEELEEHVKELKVETEEKAKKIQALNQSIRELETQHDTQIKGLVDSSKRNMESLINKSTGDIEGVLRNQMIYIETVEHKIKGLENRNLDLIQDYKAQIEHIKQCYAQRPSKSQDVDAIKGLKEKLWKKEKELEYVQDELKGFKLELENKEEVYTKIFASNNDYRAATDNNLARSPMSRDFKTKRIGRSLVMKTRQNEDAMNKTEKAEYGTFLEVPK